MKCCGENRHPLKEEDEDEEFFRLSESVEETNRSSLKVFSGAPTC